MNTQELPNNVVEVNINVDGSLSNTDAFNTVAFFSVNDDVERNIIVNSLGEVLSAGYSKESKAYDFCVGIFNQNKMSQVVLRSVRTGESYLDSYKSYSNTSYYFIVIESKDIDVILSFRQGLENLLQQKLLFFSTAEDVSDKVKGLSRLVYYYDTNLKDDLPECFYQFDSGDYIQLDSSNYLLPDTCSFYVDKRFDEKLTTNFKFVGATVDTRLFNYLNSYLYPVHTIEDISTEPVLNSSTERESIGESETHENVSSIFNIKSATQRELLKTLTVNQENVRINFKLLSVTQRDTLRNTVAKVENLSTKYSINIATQRNALIVTNNSVESLSIKFGLVSATIK